MLHILATRNENAEKLADVFMIFIKAARAYVLFGIDANYPAYSDEEATKIEMAAIWNKRREETIYDDVRRAELAVKTLKNDLIKYITNIVINPFVAATARDNFFEELGVLQTLPHCCCTINPHGDPFDEALKNLRGAVRNEIFMRCVSARHFAGRLKDPEMLELEKFVTLLTPNRPIPTNTIKRIKQRTTLRQGTTNG